MKKFRIHKDNKYWLVEVPSSSIASIPFTAQFRDFDRAISYVRYWINNLS